MRLGIAVATGVVALVLGCANPPPCEQNYSYGDACNRVLAPLQGLCGINVTSSICDQVILASCAPDGGSVNMTMRVCSQEVDRCAAGIAAAPDCSTATGFILDGGCPTTCYAP
jgi:hypothetical protein